MSRVELRPESPWSADEWSRASHARRRNRPLSILRLAALLAALTLTTALTLSLLTTRLELAEGRSVRLAPSVLE